MPEAGDKSPENSLDASTIQVVVIKRNYAVFCEDSVFRIFGLRCKLKVFHDGLNAANGGRVRPHVKFRI